MYLHALRHCHGGQRIHGYFQFQEPLRHVLRLIARKGFGRFVLLGLGCAGIHHDGHRREGQGTQHLSQGRPFHRFEVGAHPLAAFVHQPSYPLPVLAHVEAHT